MMALRTDNRPLKRLKADSTTAARSAASSADAAHSEPLALPSNEPGTVTARHTAQLLAALDAPTARLAAHAATEPRRFAASAAERESSAGTVRQLTADEVDNDCALFDAAADEADAQWRAARQNSAAACSLACPACLASVCFGAQCVGPGQFEAQRVHRCRLSRSHVVRTAADGRGETLAPLLCDACGTEVGLFSARDRTYHLFHVIDSH